jgi:DNA-binding NtrC family response regulator
LRLRLDDIDGLVRFFLAEWSAGAHAIQINSDAIAVLKRGVWPGNIRQLRQTLRRAAILAEGGVISSAIVRDAMANGSSVGAAQLPHRRRSEEVQKLLTVLTEVDWDIAMAAFRLEVTKKTIYARLQRYNVSIPNRHMRRSTIMHGKNRDETRQTRLERGG